MANITADERAAMESRVITMLRIHAMQAVDRDPRNILLYGFKIERDLMESWPISETQAHGVLKRMRTEGRVYAEKGNGNILRYTTIEVGEELTSARERAKNANELGIEMSKNQIERLSEIGITAEPFKRKPWEILPGIMFSPEEAEKLLERLEL